NNAGTLSNHLCCKLYGPDCVCRDEHHRLDAKPLCASGCADRPFIWGMAFSKNQSGSVSVVCVWVALIYGWLFVVATAVRWAMEAMYHPAYHDKNLPRCSVKVNDLFELIDRFSIKFG